MPEFLKVKNACIVLDPNGRNELNIEFAEPIPACEVAAAMKITDNRGGYLYYIEDHGIAHFGCYDHHGKFWSSRPSIFRNHGDHPIEVTFVTAEPCIGFSRQSAAITETFCKQILKDFNLPFHIEDFRPFSDNEIVSELVQNRDIIGSSFTDQHGTCWKIRGKSERGYSPNVYECFAPYERKTRYYGYENLPRSLYDGLLWEDFKALYPSGV